jgi:hypothetical protein
LIWCLRSDDAIPRHPVTLHGEQRPMDVDLVT